MLWRKEMDLHDLAIELFCRFDPDHRGYITQEQLLDSAKDNILTEGQIISVFTLLDKDEKGIITLSDFTDAFVDVSVNNNDSESIQDLIDNDDPYGQVKSSDEYHETRINSQPKSNSSEKCGCPCSKTKQCTSKLRVKCCKYDRSLKRYTSAEFLNDLLYIDKKPNKRQLAVRKYPLERRESSPNIFSGTRVEKIKSNLYKPRRWKSYDYGINCCDTLSEEIEEMNRHNNGTNGNICNNGLSRKYGSALHLSEQGLSNKLSLCPSRSSIYISDTNLERTSSKDITEELDEIFGTSDSVCKIGCDDCKSNRIMSTVDSNIHSRETNLTSVNGSSDENLNYYNNSKNSYNGINNNVKRKLSYENDDKDSGITQNSYQKKSYHSSRTKNGFMSSKNDVVITNGNHFENSQRDEIIEEEWGTYLRRIGGGPIFSGNLTLQYLWQQIKLYQSDLVFPFDKFLKSVIEEQKSVYSKFQETETTLHSKIEQHEKEINNLYEEFDIAREKEVRKLERKQHEREEHLKNEFRKIIDYKEQAYQECCKQMAHISERLEKYEEEISSLQILKKKAEEQCRFLLHEQQRYLTENQHMMHENETLKQKYKSCKTSIDDMQDHLNQLKQAADVEREKHRSFMQQYNDIVDEKSFLETSLANLSIENGELRNLQKSQLTQNEECSSISQIIPIIDLSDLSDFPLCSSSPVKSNLLKNIERSHQAISLHEELNTSSIEINEFTTPLTPVFTKMSSQKPYLSRLIKEDCMLPGGDVLNNNPNDKCNAMDSIHKECFNITHHFIACDKLNISNYHEESLELLNRSFLSYSDPLIKVEAPVKPKPKRSNKIHLAAPFKSEFKIIFCGDSNVGKTSLIYRICYGYFRPSFHKDTVEVDTFVKNVETGGQNFKLKIWDTVGQEKFHSIPHSYYRKSDVAVIMYDLTEEASFDSVKTWLNNINKFSDNALLIIIGNKIDLTNTRTISKQRGEEFAKANDAVYIETSSKSGENIDKLLYLLTTKLLDQNEFVLIQNYFEQSTLNESPSKKQCCN